MSWEIREEVNMNNIDNNSVSAGESIVYMSVPTLPPNTTPPASIHAISIINKPAGADVMRVIVRRDLSMAIRSFTFRYRFSSMPIYAPDNEHPFNTFEYSLSDINASEYITVSGNIPEGLKYNGCSAYISEILLENGQVLTFKAAEYKYVRRPIKKQISSDNTAKEANTDVPNTDDIIKKAMEETEKQKRKHLRRSVILTVLILMLIAEAIGGVFLYKYLGVRSSVEFLMKDGRFNEAYKIASESSYTGLFQRVCEKASLHYFSEGDLESSYVYAYGAPKPFCERIIDYAAQSVIDSDSGKINENAYRVAKMSESDEKFDSIIHTIVSMLESKGDFPNALRVVSEIRSAEDRLASEKTVFKNAFNYFSSSHRYYEAASFIDDIENIKTVKRSKAEIIALALECFSSANDNAGIIYFAHRYPLNADANLAQTVEPEDAGVRAELEIVYPMLSAAQKRSYHAKPLAVWNGEIKRIKDGTLAGTKTGNAVSVETNADVTVVLHTNGSVSTIANQGKLNTYWIPQYTDVVAIAVGDRHIVLLHDNGTVSVHGDNTYGQANTAEWTNIAAIAAGQRFTVGLKTDGTVVAVGSNTAGQCDVSHFRNVVDVAACNQSTVLLFADGSVEVQGYRSLGLADVETLCDVKRIEAGGVSIIAERADGTYALYSGQVGGNPGDPYNWRKMEFFDVGLMCIAGTDKSDVLYTNGDGLPK